MYRTIERAIYYRQPPTQRGVLTADRILYSPAGFWAVLLLSKSIGSLLGILLPRAPSPRGR